MDQAKHVDTAFKKLEVIYGLLKQIIITSERLSHTNFTSSILEYLNIVSHLTCSRVHLQISREIYLNEFTKPVSAHCWILWRSQSFGLQRKSNDWFLYEMQYGHEMVYIHLNILQI